ncbi:class F sortase [Virgibacillus salexigens]|uniref:class F sortase n=1 Tax=Virgibacillus salexigens TaxID=61016 RepID=UPI001F1CB904|nr:class F sortase [Virgibacillus salexigens]
MIKYIAFVGIAICLVACSPSQNETADTSVSSNPSNSNSGMKQEQLEYNSETANVENKTSDSIIKDKEYHLTPKKITIDAIDVKSEIESVGLLDNGEMAVPEDFTKTGWFDLGTKPGNRGSAVIAGHVDDKTGPGVFLI